MSVVEEEMLAATALDQSRIKEAEARKQIRDAFLTERLGTLSTKRDPLGKGDVEDLRRRLIEAQEQADRAPWHGPVSYSLFRVTPLAGRAPLQEGDSIPRAVGEPVPTAADRIDLEAAKDTADARLLKAAIEAVWQDVIAAGALEPEERSAAALTRILASSIPPGAISRITLARAWPGVRKAFLTTRKAQRSAAGVRPRLPMHSAMDEILMRAEPLEKEDASDTRHLKIQRMPDVKITITLPNEAGQIELFHPRVVEKSVSLSAALAEIPAAIGPRAAKAWLTCLYAMQMKDPKFHQRDTPTGDFLYSPGLFADWQRPRTEKGLRHKAKTIRRLDEDMRTLAQVRVSLRGRHNGEDWRYDGPLVAYQGTTLSEGDAGASIPADEFGPTRATRRRGKRPHELWRLVPGMAGMLRTKMAWTEFDPAVLRASNEALVLYVELARHAFRNAAKIEPEESWTRKVETLLDDNGIIDRDPNHPGRTKAKLERMLKELDELGVLQGTLADDHIAYTLPEDHRKALIEAATTASRARQLPAGTPPKKRRKAGRPPLR